MRTLRPSILVSLAVILAILGMVLNFLFLAGGDYPSDDAAMAATIFGAIFATVVGLIGLIYPILLIIFMRKPNVIDACNK